ncbi:uncharacterized protein LOC9629768 [Selaginella moellendorffii]|uniref:uncharacterized protein LOC9629768 n=1 Tax=Selaginella moellendorffii TaxID=88036 RepID=UPI000D1C5CF9|nr:uncharacterized protein LOC9629768 [Selaginella moellendorffii]|eukprot:XP_024517235.1 uncharacterized protein LOC9629768 [Selaginella moellendorffii]
MAAASCFGDYGVEVSSDHSAAVSLGRKAAAMNQNSVSCLYRTKLAGQCRIVTVTWSKNVIGQGLNVGVDDGKFGCKVELRPWLFWKKHGSKRFELGNRQVEVFWDLSSAKYSPGGGPEPVASFLVAIVCEEEIVLQLGDQHHPGKGLSSSREAWKRLRAAKPASIKASLLSRREHLYGKKFFATKASFCEGGELHEVIIECPTLGAGSHRGCGHGDSDHGDGDGDDYHHSRNGNSTSASGSSGLSSGSSNSSGHSSSSRSSSAKPSLKEPRLCIRIDRKVVVQVKRLAWKFRGNQTIVIDGQQVEVFWDVHNWLFSGGGNAPANSAVFMFQMCSSSGEEIKQPWLSQQQQQRDSSTGFSLFLYACRND